MAVYTTESVVGTVEDVSNVVSNIAPFDTPFQSMIGSEKINNVTHFWLEDDLAGVDDENAAVDGADADTAEHNPAVQRFNYSQILTKTCKVSGSNEAVASHGGVSGMAYQLDLKSKELKRDHEYALLNGQVKIDGGASYPGKPGDDGMGAGGQTGGVARRFDSAQAMIDAGNVIDASGGTGLTQDFVEEAAEILYGEGANPNTLMFHHSKAKDVAGWNQEASVRQKWTDAKGTEFTNQITVWGDPLGHTIKMVPNRWIKEDDALLFNSEMWSVLDYRPTQKTVLAKTGDAETEQLLRETSLKHKNFRASALITGLV